MKRDKRKTLRNRADKLYQIVGLNLYKKCEACGKPSQVIHHIIPKSLCSALRYDLKNMSPLCNSCHFKHHTQGDPVIYEKIMGNRDADWFVYIKETRQKETKTTITFYEKALKELENQNRQSG